MVKKSNGKNSSKLLAGFDTMFTTLNKHVTSINSSKIFAGLMIITLNISSKFVNLNLPKTVESYLKYTFSKQILVFAIAWMGTRDIYVALVITIVFIICIDFLFNEESSMCILPETFTEYQVSLLETVSDDEINKAKDVLAKAEKNAKEKAADISDTLAKQPENAGKATVVKDQSPFY